jgi:fatty-acyl-CoA synthase
MTYGQIVDGMAELRGSDVFISDRAGKRRVTFREFKENVDGVARSLMALGVCKGDRVAMLGMNSVDWAVMQFAVPSIGAWFVNLNAAFPEAQLGRMIDHSNPRIIVSQSHYSRSDYFSMLRNLHPTIGQKAGYW